MSEPDRKLPLTERDLDTLQELVRVAEDWRRQGFNRKLMPMDIGGTNGSHHSATLHKLHARGLCEMIKYGGRRAKGSCRYWSNRAGIDLLRELKRLPRNMQRGQAEPQLASREAITAAAIAVNRIRK
jgi:hypothetical protein